MPRTLILLLLVACQQPTFTDQELQSTSVVLMQVADGQRQLPCVTKDDAFIYLRVIQTYGKAGMPDSGLINMSELDARATGFCESDLYKKMLKDKDDFRP